MNRFRKAPFVLNGRKIITLLMLSIFSLTSRAAGLDLDDVFFRAGKYYVVVGVLCIMFASIFVFLIRLDLKVSKLEKSKEHED